jgi:hypothetical protein
VIIRLEDSFIKLAQQLGKPFSEAEKHRLAEFISDSITYDKIRSVISDQERDKERSKPTIIELGNIDERYFALNAYYNEDQMEDNIPLSIRELLPTISPVYIDVMASMSQTATDNDTRQNYMKVAQLYDDGDMHAHYVNEVIQEDSGILPIDDR